jgi:hypothetical protein
MSYRNLVTRKLASSKRVVTEHVPPPCKTTVPGKVGNGVAHYPGTKVLNMFWRAFIREGIP